VYSLRFSPDGRTLFALVETSIDCVQSPRPVSATTIQRFDARTGRALGAEHAVTRRVVLVDLMVTHDVPVTGAAFTADGRRAVTIGADGRAIVWDVTRVAATETLAGHAGRISGLAISRDGATLYTAGLDRKVLVWDLAARAPRRAEQHRGPAVHARRRLSARGHQRRTRVPLGR
jgi:WD40 repeat protein